MSINLTDTARKLRKESTDAEQLLWEKAGHPPIKGSSVILISSEHDKLTQFNPCPSTATLAILHHHCKPLTNGI